MAHPTLRVSKSADGLAQRIAVMLTSGARPAQFFRVFAASKPMYEQAIGLLFLRGQVKFVGNKKSRRLARNTRS